MKRSSAVAMGVALAAGLASSAAMATVVYTGSSGNLSASATFTVSGDDLLIDLRNTATLSPVDSAGVLSGLFFDLGNGLSPLSATVLGGSIAQADRCDVAANCATLTNVGGEFSYYFGSNRNYISSSGYLPGNTSSGNFGGSDLDSPSRGAGWDQFRHYHPQFHRWQRQRWA